jgi:hypothetical protein
MSSTSAVINHKFVFHPKDYLPASVIVTGTFDGWVGDKEMVYNYETKLYEREIGIQISHKNASSSAADNNEAEAADKLEQPLLLPVQYKFIVDGKWMYDELEATVYDDSGIENNVVYLYVDGSAKNVSEAAATVAAAVASKKLVGHDSGLDLVTPVNAFSQKDCPAGDIPDPTAPLEVRAKSSSFASLPRADLGESQHSTSTIEAQFLSSASNSIIF